MSRGRFCALFSLVMFAGCGASDAPLPSQTEAKAAVTAALDTWKNGKPASDLESAKPPIQAVDSDWATGKVLESYTIGDESPGTGTKTFSATLTLKGASGPVNVKYMVFGKEPMRVYRDVDFERMSNMENNPTPPKTPRR